MDAVLSEATIHQRRQALGRMTNGLGLQDAYSTTLNRIRKQDGSKARLGMEVLMWLSRCERALKSEELCNALGVELGAEDINIRNVPSIRTGRYWAAPWDLSEWTKIHQHSVSSIIHFRSILDSILHYLSQLTR